MDHAPSYYTSLTELLYNTSVWRDEAQARADALQQQLTTVTALAAQRDTRIEELIAECDSETNRRIKVEETLQREQANSQAARLEREIHEETERRLRIKVESLETDVQARNIVIEKLRADAASHKPKARKK